MSTNKIYVDANVRYLALDGLARKARYCGAVDVLHHMGTVLASLRDADISVRHRALDLVFLMVSSSGSLHNRSSLVFVLYNASHGDLLTIVLSYVYIIFVHVHKGLRKKCQRNYRRPSNTFNHF